MRSGNGKGIVYATGISSEFGSIFQMMKEVGVYVSLFDGSGKV